MRMEWHATYETGVDFIDADHRGLMEFINQLTGCINSDENRILSILDEFLIQFRRHASREEAILKKFSFDQLDEHAKEHSEAIGQIEKFRGLLSNDNSGPAVEAVVSYLTKWFFDHVVGKDLQLSTLYRQHGAAKQRRTTGILESVDIFLCRFKVKNRILMAALIPSILAFAVTFFLISGKLDVVSEMKRVEALADYAVNVGNLVHELQGERGVTALVIGGNNAQRSNLNSRRIEVDRLRKIVSTNQIGNGTNALDKLDEIRTSVDSATKKQADIVDEYSSLIVRLLNNLSDVAQSLESAKVSNQLNAYLSLTQGKERAGQERAIGTVGFSEAFPSWRYKRFVDRSAQQSAYFNTYKNLVSQAKKQEFMDMISGRIASDYEKIRDSAAINMNQGSIDPQSWFSAATARIEVLKKAENAAANDLMFMASSIRLKAQSDLYLISAAMVLLMVGGIIATALIIRSVVTPFTALTATISKIASGEKNTAVPCLEREDEIGEMARVIMVFRGALLSNDTMQARQIAEGAFRETRILRREQLTTEFDERISQFVGVLASSSTELVATANEMARVAGDTTSRSTAVAAASEETSVNIQTVASAVEELAASVSEITRQVSQSATISANAVQEAERTDGIVMGLSEAANKIGTVAALIENIASQTNLLALNATIEAARAGEAGKGFTVVANEVKNLAYQTVKATADIGEQIRSIQEATSASVEAIRSIGGTIREINGISTAIASAVEEQSAATSEISRNVHEASKAVNDVNKNIADVSSGASQTGAAASQVLQAAGDVSKQSELIRKDVVQFLSGIKSIQQNAG